MDMRPGQSLCITTETKFSARVIAIDLRYACTAAVLSLDAADTTGEHAAHSSFASNGEIHKIRLSAEGQRIGLGEYIPPQRYGFMLNRPRQVCVRLQPLSTPFPAACLALLPFSLPGGLRHSKPFWCWYLVSPNRSFRCKIL